MTDSEAQEGRTAAVSEVLVVHNLLCGAHQGTGHIVRFIEYMDVGTTNGWRLDKVVPAKEIVERIDTAFALEPVAPVTLMSVGLVLFAVSAVASVVPALRAATVDPVTVLRAD